MGLEKYIKPIQIGPLKLENNLFYGPMAGCSDYSFRQRSVAYLPRPGLIFTEMVKMEPLVRGDATTLHILDYAGGQHPIGAQMVGSNIELAAESAAILAALGFDLIDLNCGCPVDKVTQDGSGSGLLRNPERIGRIIEEMRKGAPHLPITVKIRAGWDETSINAAYVTQIAEEAGASAIAIHARTRAQGYKGEAQLQWIAAAKAAARRIKVVGNGDVTTPEKALRMFEETGCDAVLVSRATLGHPWFMSRLMGGSEVSVKEALLAHLEEVVQYKDSERAALEMRKVGCWYLHDLEGVRALREAINKQSSLSQLRSLLEAYDWNQVRPKDLAHGLCT